MKSTIALILLLIPVSVFADTTATFTLPSGVKVQIIEAPFDKARFKISGCTETSTRCLINGRVPVGAAGVLPKTYVKQISVSYKGQSYLLDARDMYDAWGDRPLEHKQFGIRYFGGKCFDAKNCQFRGVFSDASGAFVAEWSVYDGVSIRTVLSSDDDIIALFSKNIDPPEYN